jgi:hypothetical protein
VELACCKNGSGFEAERVRSFMGVQLKGCAAERVRSLA